MTKEDGIEFMYRPKLFHHEGRYCFREDIFWFEAIVETKDYGKTWSFVQEELIKVREIYSPNVTDIDTLLDSYESDGYTCVEK